MRFRMDAWRWISVIALALIAASVGCAERRAEGGACVFNDDCADPLICAGSFCRAQCHTDRDCPGGWRCNNAGVPGKQVCLPPPAPVLCVGDEHCPASATCTSAHQCRWRRARDPDCQSHRASLTCVTANVCSASILVVELDFISSDGGVPDGGTSDAPAIDSPTLDAPVTDAPVTDAPIADAPATDAPVTDASVTDTGPRCARDFQCDDGVFCDGAERCDSTDPAADARGCAPPTGPRCMTGQRCDERMGRCLTMCEVTPDADEDGFNAASCGGPDCDDARASVHPGAPELCNGLDDDCDRMTDEEGAALCALRFATAACASGACAVVSCSAGRGDCDGVAANGCETELAANPTNCGACGRLCALTLNATAMACRTSACAVATCQAGSADCDGVASNGCEQDVSSDVRNCGRCGARCTDRPSSHATCVAGACAIACDADRADCDHDPVNGCEVDLSSDRANCGACGARCLLASDACVAGSCVAQPFASNASEGAFAPMPSPDAGTSVVVLSAGVHHFSTVTIPAGVTVVTDGDGVLELRATGDVVIDGSLDVSGGHGGAGASGASACVGNGGGGATGRANVHGATGSGVCAAQSAGGAGSPGGDAASGCARGGAYGGGAGGASSLGGGGGGGVAGGGGAGNISSTGAGGAGASVAAFGTGGIRGDLGRSFGGGGEEDGTIPVVYRGGNGANGTGCTNSGGGGGGSIGARAAMDLAVRDPLTFRAGSGGGGGAGAWVLCTGPAAGGGGGGGGALRIASSTRILVRGSVLARGGGGGLGATTSVGGAGGGGGGSGGVIYLSAPAIDVVSGTLSVEGGVAGSLPACAPSAGHGGLGRLRLLVIPARCHLTGSWNPPLPTGGCAVTPTAAAGQVYIGAYPD